MMLRQEILFSLLTSKLSLLHSRQYCPSFYYSIKFFAGTLLSSSFAKKKVISAIKRSKNKHGVCFDKSIPRVMSEFSMYLDFYT